MRHFADRLICEIRRKGNPCVIGLDYHANHLPSFVIKGLKRRPTAAGYRTAIVDYFRRIIDAVSPFVPAVKPQVSLLESIRVWPDILFDTVRTAQEQGLLVIVDAKRGDIASSAVGYSEAYLGKSEGPEFARGYDADAMTVNAFLGRDTLAPYVDACISGGKGIFVLVKTSNKGSVETQDAVLQDSEKRVYALYARMAAELGSAVMGTSGYSSVGAVVGATFPDQAREIRRMIPKGFILVPGYGAQGATSDDVAVNFNEDGLGAVVNASRSITASFPRSDISPKAYTVNVQDNVKKMVDDITSAIARRNR